MPMNTWHYNLGKALKYLLLKTLLMAKSTKAASAVAPKKAITAKAEPNGNANNGNPEDKGLLEKFFLNGLKDIYWAEKALTKALPKMQKAATTQQLRDAFGTHLTVTRDQVARLEEVFELLGKKPQAKKCEAMEGLLKESESMIEETEKGSMTRDVALIMAAQKVEHYEIATYGGLAQLAKTLGHDNAKNLLGTTLSEEKEADDLLTQIAEANINMMAGKE